MAYQRADGGTAVILRLRALPLLRDPGARYRAGRGGQEGLGRQVMKVTPPESRESLVLAKQLSPSPSLLPQKTTMREAIVSARLQHSAHASRGRSLQQQAAAVGDDVIACLLTHLVFPMPFLHAVHPHWPGRRAGRQCLLGALLPGARHPARWPGENSSAGPMPL